MAVINRCRYVGYFGNADPLDPSQWFRLAAPPSGTSWQWNDATSTCSSMITGTFPLMQTLLLSENCFLICFNYMLLTKGINYKFLVGYTGEKSNPQSKIISATVDYTSQDFRMRSIFCALDDLMDCATFFKKYFIYILFLL